MAVATKVVTFRLDCMEPGRLALEGAVWTDGSVSLSSGEWFRTRKEFVDNLKTRQPKYMMQDMAAEAEVTCPKCSKS